jgi:hypothetical protein
MKARVTRSEEGGFTTELRRGVSAGVAAWHGRGAARRPWRGGARGGGGGAAGSVMEGGRGRGAAWWAGSAGWADWPLGRLGRKLKKKSF